MRLVSLLVICCALGFFPQNSYAQVLNVQIGGGGEIEKLPAKFDGEGRSAERCGDHFEVVGERVRFTFLVKTARGEKVPFSPTLSLDQLVRSVEEGAKVPYATVLMSGRDPFVRISVSPAEMKRSPCLSDLAPWSE